MNFFRIFKRVNNLTYKLKLLKFFRIYNVIFVIYLKQIILNFFARTISLSLLLIIENNELYVIKKILQKNNKVVKLNI